MKRFKFDPDKYKNFAEYFDLAANKSEPHKAFKFVQILQRNTKHFKKATTFVLSAIVFGAGLFILPGGKIGVQRDLKTQTVKIGTEVIDSFADLTQSYSTKLYLNRLLLTAFLFLDQNEIFTPDIGKTQLNKLTVAVIDYADKDYEIVLSTLNYLSIFIPKLIQKEPDFFLDEEVQNSLLNLVDILVEKTNLTRVQRLLKDEKSLVDQNLYTYEVVNYQSIVQSLLVILRYSKNDTNKALCYKLFNKFATKDYSELITAEDVFCTIDGIQIVLSDLSSKNKEVQSAALVTTCLLFKNDDQAIKLLKTRILSNLIQNLKDPSYQLYLKKILEAIKDNRKKNLLLTHSELFKVEKERLTQLSQDKTVDQQIRELLKSFLKTS